MGVTIGTQLGSLEILSLLGRGGMGEVYRARDTKLKREVAIKILPDEFSRDPDRVARFHREAEVLASLNHPNIAAIYDLEEADGSRFLVLELVEGETLAERVKRGPIPIDEALSIAKSICEALEAAHDKGVVHRDLKPANVKITPDGKVKVLDFGLAKAMELSEGNAGLSNSPTAMSVAATNAGMIMGTAAYMSPEQAKGQIVDRRTDIFALGCVLYEMLTGRQAFPGESVGDILAAVIRADPDWTRLPQGTPPSVRKLLRRCLQKDRNRRWQYAADARIEIEEVGTETETEVAAVAPGAARRRERIWISISALLALAALAVGGWALRPAPPLAEMRLDIATLPTADPASMAISPDGQKIVFVGTNEGRSQLWLRSLDSVSTQPLKLTEGAAYPFWSPDSRSLAFFADGRLKRIDIAGGSIEVLATAPAGRGGDWNRDGIILFAPSGGSGGGILRVAATGGAASAVTQVQPPQQVSHRLPKFLPDGKHFVYYAQGEARGVYVASLDGSGAQRLLDADTAAVYASSGQLLFVRQGTLFAQSFDLSMLKLIGNPFPVAEQVTVDTSVFLAALSTSAAGPIGYRTGSAGSQRQLTWFDRSGTQIGVLGELDGARPLSPSLSPDGRRIAVGRTLNGNSDVWLFDLMRGVPSRFTFDPAVDGSPIWSPDGTRIVFSSTRKGNALYQKSATAVGTEDLLLATPQAKNPTDWSPDGRFILYSSTDTKTGSDIFAVPVEGDGKPVPVVQTNFDERSGQFSPDGKWIAYESNESGRLEIYVQPFPSPGSKFQISTNGGAQVRWRRDGKELFYIALDGRLTAISIRTASNGQSIEAGEPVPLFETHIGGGAVPGNTPQYIVSADGQRFLMSKLAEESWPITLILNWSGDLKR